MKTKIITTFALFALFALIAQADTFTEGGLNYLTLTDNSVAVTIGSYSGTYNVPASVNHSGKTYTVTEIGDSAFFKCSNVTTVTIPQTVTRLGLRSFAYSGITQVTVPPNVVEMASYCFAYCTSLQSFNFNATRCTLDNYSTYTQFKGTSIPVMEVGVNVELLPNGLYYAYTGSEVVVSASVQEIGRSTFYGTKNVKKITYNATNCTSSTSSPFYYLRNTTEDFIIGEGVKNIPDYLLCDFINVTTINLPASLTTIGKHAFENCGITSIDLNNVTTIDAYGFYNSALTSINIPEHVTTIGPRAFSGCKSLTSVTYYASNCTEITSDNNTWFRNSPIKNITLGPKVTHIPAYIAYENTEIETFDIPSQVTSIGEYAFCNSALTSITIPKKITSIGSHAFGNCKSMTNVYFNAEHCESPTTSLGSAFYNSTITNFAIGEDVRHIPSYLLYRVKSLEALTIPEGVTTIGKNPFDNCTNLREFNYNAVRCVADPPITDRNTAWFNDTHLYTLKIGENVEVIPEYIAYNQDSISVYNIPDGVKEIGRYAFYSCASLKKIEFPSHIEKIGDYVFYNNKQMTGNIVIPASLKSIGKYIISNCEKLGNIIVEAPVASPTHKNTFGYDIHHNKWLIVPRGASQSYKAAEGWCEFRRMINDTNDDNVIDVGDVNLIIDTILFDKGDEIIKSCDIDGSKEVDVSDVNVVIDFILGL